MPANNRTRRTRLARGAVVATGALVLALTPAAAYAADTTKSSVAGTGGSAVSITTGVLAVATALYLAYRRGTVLLVLLAIAAGAMLSGTSFAATLSDLTDHLAHAVVDAVTAALS
ncbi:hypothetical protein [Embleya hyalina]|uniref:Uncharacterized protein n=1 Tax=Embleya hyalina TaxID=516124 RepID=A0A401YYN4_9ACTN|nr:hypothetical protein [Embleya hyalina]GCD99742.1 hypothetical protein EHYA_07464 [Embleya hyalina]